MDGRIALFDMDDTLFGHIYQLGKDLERLRSPNEPVPDISDRRNPRPAWLEARMELIKRQPGWWRDLPILDTGWQILKACQEIGFCCRILTKGPRTKSLAWMEKLECVNHHLGESFPVDMVNSGSDDGKDKGNTYGRVLVDDYPPFVEYWLKHRKRGLGVIPAHPWNESFTHPNVFRYSGPEDMPRLRPLLYAAFVRESGQHWNEVLNLSC